MGFGRHHQWKLYQGDRDENAALLSLPANGLRCRDGISKAELNFASCTFDFDVERMLSEFLCSPPPPPHIQIILIHCFSGWLICWSRIYGKNVGHIRTSVSDLPASTSMSSLQMLQSMYFPQESGKCVLHVLCMKVALIICIQLTLGVKQQRAACSKPCRGSTYLRTAF
jgi:hypothetical protein